MLPLPHIVKKTIYDISPELLSSRGVRFLMLDVDNTLSPYTVDKASDELKAWIDGLKSGGIELFILSNNRGQRPAIFAQQLGIDYVGRAKKPSRKAAEKAMLDRGYSPKETALVGDQIFTDTLCARRIGATAILVEPIKFTNILLRLRYWVEIPFRREAKR